MAKYKLKWLQGMINCRLGSTRHAERLYLKAREGLIELGAACEVAMISLDITLVYFIQPDIHTSDLLPGPDKPPDPVS